MPQVFPRFSLDIAGNSPTLQCKAAASSVRKLLRVHSVVMNGTLSGFLISGLFSFKVSFLGTDLSLEIWLFTKLFLYPRFVK